MLVLFADLHFLIQGVDHRQHAATITAVIPTIDVICNTVVADSVAARIAIDCQNRLYLKQNAQKKSKD